MDLCCLYHLPFLALYLPLQRNSCYPGGRRIDIDLMKNIIRQVLVASNTVDIFISIYCHKCRGHIRNNIIRQLVFHRNNRHYITLFINLPRSFLLYFIIIKYIHNSLSTIYHNSVTCFKSCSCVTASNNSRNSNLSSHNCRM